MKSEISKLHQAFVKELRQQMGMCEKPKEKFRVERKKRSESDEDILKSIQADLEKKFDELFGTDDGE